VAHIAGALLPGLANWPRSTGRAALVAGAEDVALGVGGTGKFICIGLNYADHAAETGAAIPAEPVVFNKWITAMCGPDDDVEIPRGSVKTDWEVELGVVIGTGGKYIDEADALSHVAGYCVINDVSERYQNDRGTRQGLGTFHPTGTGWSQKEAGDFGASNVARRGGHRYQTAPPPR
jgi:2,4-diketo-3-deoxy-L-fuconate hydrolase